MISSVFHRPQLTHTIALTHNEVAHVASSSEVLSTRVDKDGRRQLDSFQSVPEMADDSYKTSRVIWRASARKASRELSPKSQLTLLLPLDLDTVVLGYGKH